MGCINCKGGVYHNGLCRPHFLEQIESRVAREIRLSGGLSKGDVLAVKEPLCRHLVKKAVGGMPLLFVRGAKKAKGKNAKVVSGWMLDDEVISFMMDFFGEKIAEKQIPEEIRPLRLLKEDELIAYARLVKIRFKKKKRTAREEEMKKELERIEKKHLETKYSLLKSVREMGELNPKKMQNAQD